MGRETFSIPEEIDNEIPQPLGNATIRSEGDMLRRGFARDKINARFRALLNESELESLLPGLPDSTRPSYKSAWVDWVDFVAYGIFLFG